MLKEAGWALIALFACFLLFWIVDARNQGKGETGLTPKSVLSAINSTSPTGTRAHAAAPATVSCTDTDPPLYTGQPLQTLERLDQRRETRFGLDTPMERLRALSDAGDEDAALTLFASAMSCRDYRKPIVDGPGESDCAKFPPSLSEQPLKLLDNAIQHGSAQAKLQYAMHAVTFLKWDQRSNQPPEPRKARDTLQTAERYGAEAARAGLADAYWFMARAYISGDFGVRDPQSSYVYLLALSESQPIPGVDAELQSLRRHMSLREIAAAEQRVFGCPGKHRPDETKNPFLHTSP